MPWRRITQRHDSPRLQASPGSGDSDDSNAERPANLVGFERRIVDRAATS